MIERDGLVPVYDSHGRKAPMDGAYLGLWIKLSALGRRILDLQAKARADKVRRGCGCAGMGGRTK